MNQRTVTECAVEFLQYFLPLFTEQEKVIKQCGLHRSSPFFKPYFFDLKSEEIPILLHICIVELGDS